METDDQFTPVMESSRHVALTSPYARQKKAVMIGATGKVSKTYGSSTIKP